MRSFDVEAVVLDMDGTIIDSKEAYVSCLLDALEKVGYPRRREEVAGLVIPSIVGTVRAVLSQREDLVVEVEGLVREYIAEHSLSLEGNETIPLCPGAREGILRLSDRYRLGLLTASSRVMAEAVLGGFDLLRLFHSLATVDLDLPTKDERYVYLLGELRTTPKETLLVGDTVSDVLVAKRAGSPCVAIYNPCSWCWPKEEELLDAGPDLIIRSLNELPI